MVGAFLIIWLGLLIAPPLRYGFDGLLEELPNALYHPFTIVIVPNSFKIVGVLLLLYALVVIFWLTDNKNYRRREESGSAKWGDVRQIVKNYRHKNEEKLPLKEQLLQLLKPKRPEEEYNRILTQNFYQGIDSEKREQKYQRNLNTLVVGGSGSGKTFFYAKPNIMQANTSYVVLDPKGELTQDLGGLLESKGYVVKVLDLKNMSKSHRYNPFRYLHTENDVQRLVTNLFNSTTPKGSKSNDPFWDNAAMMFLNALFFLIAEEAEPQNQNFAEVMDLLREAAVSEQNKEGNLVDMMIEEIRARDERLGKQEQSMCVKCYDLYNLAAAKTKQSILITLAARLQKFDLPDVAALTMTDELELELVGERKTAIFAVIPDNDTSFNFLVSILYTQLFQELYHSADEIHKNEGMRLPVPVHFVMDEFANVSLPDDFDKLLATMRSRKIFVSIIIQNIAQLKTLFEKQWESIMGNCDEFLFLGGMEYETYKIISERLGKETIDTTTSQHQHGSRGSFTTTSNFAGRELLTPDEVGRIDNEEAILFVRNELPIRDKKYFTPKHPNISLTHMGGQPAYEHGLVRDSVGRFRASRTLSEDENAILADIGENSMEFVNEDGIED